MNTLINKVFSLSAIWRYSFLVALSLFCAHLIYQSLLLSQTSVIKQNENKLSQFSNKINRYYRDRKNMLGQQQVFNELDQQLFAFEKTLARFNEEAPERAVLNSAVESRINTDEIKISKREQDEFGYYYLVNISVTGDQQNIAEFFSQLLRREELAIWEQIEFQQLDDQLSMSLSSRYYFEISDDIHE